MKKIFRFIAVAATVAAAASCAKEIAPVEGIEGEAQLVPCTFEASLPETKATLNGLEVLWQEGDTIAVYSSSTSHSKHAFVLKSGAGTKSAVFEGTLPAGFNQWYAVYPFSAGGKMGAITIPTVQNIASGASVDPSALIMTFRDKGTGAGKSTKSFTFTNACGIARMTVPAGTTTATFGALGSCYTATLAAAPNGPATVDVVLPAATYKDILVSVTTGEGSFVKASDNDLTIAKGSVLKLGEVKGEPASLISTGAELKTFLESSSKTNAYVIKDLDLTGIALPDSATISGVFDGRGCSIKNAALKAAIFNTNNGTIKNVVIDGTCAVSPEHLSDTTLQAAALVKTNNGTVSNCQNNAPIKFESDEAVKVGSEGLVVAFAGITIVNKGKVLNCTNNADITYSVNNISHGWSIAGVASYSEGEVSGCVNNGKISCKAERCNSKKAIGQQEDIPGCLGGIVCTAGSGMIVKDCINNGDLDYNVYKIEGATSNMNRNMVGGIVAAPSGDISNCTNNGSVTVKAKTSTGEQFLVPLPKTPSKNVEYITCVGGISGGDFYAMAQTEKGIENTQTVSNILNCCNNGKIDFDGDAAASNSVASGIVGWPGVEGAQDITTKGCVNHGDINVGGTLKCRIGGIQGGTGNIEGCTNDGNITVASTVNKSSLAASLCGFHSQNHIITGCNAYGSVKCEGSIAGCGGLIGQHGNVANTVGTGCKVNCELSSPNSSAIGLAIGVFSTNSDPTKIKNVSIGTSESPVKVAGKVNGVEITAENYAANLYGSNNFSATNHFVYASFNDDPVLAYAGKIYKIVKLADGKWWMAENLRYIPDGVTVSADGTDLNAKMWYPYTSDGSVCTADKTDAAINARGYLYSYDLLLGFKEYDETDLAKFTDANIAADPTIARGICPEGWHIPSAAEYYNLCGQGNTPYATKKTDAVFWDASLATPMATVTKAEAAGWNFAFPGVVINASYNKGIIDAAKTDQTSYIGNNAMSYYPSSTYHEYKSNGYKFFAMMSTFNTSTKGKLSLADCIAYNTNTKNVAGVAVRCVKNN